MKGFLWWLLGTSEAAIRVDQTHQCLKVVFDCANAGVYSAGRVAQRMKELVEKYRPQQPK